MIGCCDGSTALPRVAPEQRHTRDSWVATGSCLTVAATVTMIRPNRDPAMVRQAQPWRLHAQHRPIRRATMTFEEILNQAIALLQRQGRVSYRALKRQFDLDEAYVEDLKLELIEVHRVAVDQDNAMLVWIGGFAGPAPTA